MSNTTTVAEVCAIRRAELLTEIAHLADLADNLGPDTEVADLSPYPDQDDDTNPDWREWLCDWGDHPDNEATKAQLMVAALWEDANSGGETDPILAIA